MVGLPGEKYHLEFTSHVDGSPGQGAIAFADPDDWRIVLMPNRIELSDRISRRAAARPG